MGCVSRTRIDWLFTWKDPVIRTNFALLHGLSAVEEYEPAPTDDKANASNASVLWTSAEKSQMKTQ